MSANVEAEIQEKVRALPPEEQERVLHFVEELANGSPHETIWEKLQRHLRDVPDTEFAELPSDASENLDHYLYGAPKK
jgi:hypothetical protein